jgi:steroid delta-isomerase-like uncharacterized protein
VSREMMNPVDTFYRVLNERDFDLWNEAIAESYVGHVNGRDIPDRERGKDFVQALLSAFPNLRYTVEDLVVEGDRVVTRWSATGTHRGAFAGLAPTHRDVFKVGITIFRIQNGQIVELWNVWDQHGLVEQLTAASSTDESLVEDRATELQAEQLEEIGD